MLYGLMLDRMGLSTRNGWLDAGGEHILYVLECMGKTTTLIGNIRAV